MLDLAISGQGKDRIVFWIPQPEVAISVPKA